MGGEAKLMMVVESCGSSLFTFFRCAYFDISLTTLLFFFFFLSFFHFLSFFSLTSAYGLRTDGLIRYYFKSYSPFFCVFYLILLYY